MTGESWRVVVMPPARRAFDRLPIAVAAAVLETLDAIAQNPRRLGKPLMFKHQGRFSARRGPYRIIYELDEPEHVVRVIAIGHRRDIYRRGCNLQNRLAKTASAAMVSRRVPR